MKLYLSDIHRPNLKNSKKKNEVTTDILNCKKIPREKDRYDVVFALCFGSNQSRRCYVLYEILFFFSRDIRTSLLIIQARKYVDWMENVQWMGSFFGLRYRLRSKFNKSRLQAKFKFHI